MNNEGLTKFVSALLLVATAALGWISLKDAGVSPVIDSRTTTQIPADEQDVVARLWEDPLQAVQAEIWKPPEPGKAGSNSDQGTSIEKHTVPAMATAVARRAGLYKLCFLVVPIPDGPFPDEHETRLRIRYGVQMALAQEGIAPENRNALGFFKLIFQPVVSPDSGKVQAKDGYVPYEWFLNEVAQVSVLVLWLPEGMLNREPLEVLAHLRQSLAPEENCEVSDKLNGFFVIGPRSSDTFKLLVSAVPRGDCDIHPAYSVLKDKLCIFSPHATTPDALVGLDPQRYWCRARRELESRLHETITGTEFTPAERNRWCYFYNFIAPDDQLTDLLVAELSQRGVDLDASQDGILILAEADTQYGRSLPLAFQASLRTARNKAIHYFEGCFLSSSETPRQIQKGIESASDDTQVLVYHFLSGLDQQKGHQENAKATARPDIKTPEEALAAVLSKQGAMPLGESQLDYVDRLADDLQRDTKAANIKAVGVVGGSLYDKLILLRSLRSKFPRAVFFTTDLDARMWHPDHLPFTRNLIVASAYGVRVTETNDGNLGAISARENIPAFRDGYQVAVFNACRAALRKANLPTAPVELCPPPMIFELGRNGPIPLAPRIGDSPLERSVASPETGTEKAKRGSLRRTGFYFLLGGGILCIVIAVARRKRNTRGKWFAANRWIIITAAISLALLSVFYAWSQYLAELPGGEPWSWADGASIWPTELVRLVVAGAVVTTFVWVWKHFTDSCKTLGGDFFLVPGETAEPATQATTRFSAEWAFQKYLKRAGRARRAGRVFLITVAYLLLAYGMVFLVDEGMPVRPNVRGDTARTWDMVVLFISTTCFLALIFYVLDAVILTVDLLNDVTRTEIAWPAKLLEKYVTDFGVLATDLPGYLNVEFAAEKSKEVGRLILFPFIIQFLFILSRNSYFDNWTWPGTLIVIFICNILLACAGWLILRRCAKRIREEALEAVTNLADNVARGFRPVPDEPAVESTTWRDLWQTFLSGPRKKIVPEPDTKVNPTNRRDGLLRLQKLIENEKRGAYSSFFQDPALFAVVLPSGMFGILVVLAHALFGGS